jgi:hypothetical protein
MPDPKVETAIEYAKRLGTFNEFDRSKQYEGRYGTEQLRRNDNLVFARLRKIESEKFWHKVCLAILTAALMKAPEIVAWLGKIL